jgi:hypothetical protein
MLSHLTPQHVIRCPQRTFCFVQFSICYALSSQKCPFWSPGSWEEIRHFREHSGFITLFIRDRPMSSLWSMWFSAYSHSHSHSHIAFPWDPFLILVPHSRTGLYFFRFYGLKLYVHILYQVKPSVYQCRRRGGGGPVKITRGPDCVSYDLSFSVISLYVRIRPKSLCNSRVSLSQLV